MGLVTCGVILVYAKNFLLWLTENKKTLVLEPKPIIEEGENREENQVTIRAVGYNYEECMKALGKTDYT